jgi:hypothetical protein
MSRACWDSTLLARLGLHLDQAFNVLGDVVAKGDTLPTLNVVYEDLQAAVDLASELSDRASQPKAAGGRR